MKPVYWIIGAIALAYLGKKGVDMKTASDNEKRFAPLIAETEKANGIPAGLLHRLIETESNFNPLAHNKQSGALGIAQFMPATAAEWGLTNRTNPEASIRTAGIYIAWLYRQFGDWTKAVAAYNWGIGNVQRLGLARAPSETRNYVLKITGVRIA